MAEQAEIVIKQMEQCLEAAGSSLGNVICPLCTGTIRRIFQTINEVCARFFPPNPPARNLIFVSGWHGPFDVEVSCIAET